MCFESPVFFLLYLCRNCCFSSCHCVYSNGGCVCWSPIDCIVTHCNIVSVQLLIPWSSNNNQHNQLQGCNKCDTMYWVDWRLIFCQMDIEFWINNLTQFIWEYECLFLKQIKNTWSKYSQKKISAIYSAGRRCHYFKQIHLLYCHMTLPTWTSFLAQKIVSVSTHN